MNMEFILFAASLFVGWNAYLHRTLHLKAYKAELDDLKAEVEKLKDRMYTNMATRADIERLEGKLDKLIDNMLKGRKR